MLNIVICDDQKESIKKIKDVITELTTNINVICEAQNPAEVLNYLKTRNAQTLYFLDIDLNNETDGFCLATEIRKYDPRGFMVIVTNSPDSHLMLFEHALEVIDYINKDDSNFHYKLCRSFEKAYERHEASLLIEPKRIAIKLAEDIEGKHFKGDTVYINLEDIYYVESISSKKHHVAIHCMHTTFTTRISLKEIQLDNRFAQCHKSYIINVNKMVISSQRNKEVALNNGTILDIGRKYIENLRDGIRRNINSPDFS